jgi:tetratricopeptide (TPR) repeat protein
MIDIPNESVGRLIFEMNESYRAGRHERAHSLCKQILEQQLDLDAVLSAGRILESLGRFNEAIKAYDITIEDGCSEMQRQDAFSRKGHCYRDLARSACDIGVKRRLYNDAKQSLMMSLSGDVEWRDDTVRAGITLVDVLTSLGEPGTAIHVGEMLAKYPGFQENMSECDEELLSTYIRAAIDSTQRRYRQ